ncbi:hypothetical protein DSO57_1021189 [Entomophthora muscae]|uniref:Uncharacterized protein n=1 Tax=Entomophthora muscae TaxID=34485 RepID=A0ACC2T3D4_9FUNG|nr:hypothetical protein DSO57_1021189 [Entomophthora muscae]
MSGIGSSRLQRPQRHNKEQEPKIKEHEFNTKEQEPKTKEYEPKNKYKESKRFLEDSNQSLASTQNNPWWPKSWNTTLPDADKGQVTLDLEEKARLRALGPNICIMDFEPTKFNAYEQLFDGKAQGSHFYYCQKLLAM